MVSKEIIKKLESLKTASYLQNIGHWPSRVFGDVVEHIGVRFEDALHLLSLENLVIADIKKCLMEAFFLEE